MNWLPKIVECLRNYDRKTFLSDLIAGVNFRTLFAPPGVAPATMAACRSTAGG